MIWTLTMNPAWDVTLALPVRLRGGGLNRSAPPETGAGGKGVNVSRALKRLGGGNLPLTTVVLGGIPGDPEAAAFRLLLETEGLNPILLPGGGIRRCYSVTEPTGRCTEINEPGSEPPDGGAGAENLLRENLRAGDTLLLCGSLPPGVPVSLYTSLIALARARGAYVAADCDGAALRAAAAARPDLLKPNRAEFCRLCGVREKNAPEDLADFSELVGDYALALELTVLCTMGAQGAIYSDGALALALPVEAVVPRHSVKGAGDTFLGAFLWYSRLAPEPLPVFPAMQAAAATAAAWLAGEN